MGYDQIAHVQKVISCLSDLYESARSTHENTSYLSDGFPYCVRHTLDKALALKNELDAGDFQFLLQNLGYFYQVCNVQGQYPQLSSDQKFSYREKTKLFVEAVSKLVEKHMACFKSLIVESGFDYELLQLKISFLKQKLEELGQLERQTHDPQKLTVALELWDKRTLQKAADLGLDLLVSKLLDLSSQSNYGRSRDLRNCLGHRRSLISAILDDVKCNPDEYAAITKQVEMQPIKQELPDKQHSVFIVHGRDELSREKVESYLKDLGIRPIVLFKQPSNGKTIIEKFEHYSSVRFAVVILNCEDIGILKSELKQRDAGAGIDLAEFEDRARQNVVFEMGYFFAKLGRGNVAALMVGKVSKPSDVDGIAWISMDNSSQWKLDLAREMKSAGLEVDMNNLV